MNRHETREQIFIFLFESTFGDREIDEIIESAQLARDVKVNDYCRKVFKGVRDKQEEIDKHIEENIKNWSKDRLSRTTISILRLAIYEILFEESLPSSVSINEAVEIAKKYSTQKDASYINGVLGSINRKIHDISQESVAEQA